MNQRAQNLATRFAQVNQAIADLVEHCSDLQWRTLCPVEGWSVGVTAHHVAAGYDQEGWVAALIAAIVAGQALPEHPAERHPERDYNEWHAQRFATCTPAETLALLRHNGAATLRLIESLKDEELDRTTSGASDKAPVSVQQAIEAILIDHPQEHLKSLRATLGERRV